METGLIIFAAFGALAMLGWLVRLAFSALEFVDECRNTRERLATLEKHLGVARTDSFRFICHSRLNGLELEMDQIKFKLKPQKGAK